MSAVRSLTEKSDAARIAVLVRAVDKLAAGQPTTLGQLAEALFGWSTERTFLAIDRALHSGQIERAGGRGAGAVDAEAAVKEHARRELWALTETLSNAFAGDLDVDRSVVESFVYGVREFLLALAPKGG
jgi:hypothetical protein